MLRERNLPLQLESKFLDINLIENRLNSLASIGFQNFILKVNIDWFPHDRLWNSSQSFQIVLAILRKDIDSLYRPKYNPLCETQTFRFNKNQKLLKGWAIMKRASRPEPLKGSYFFESNTEHYNLGEIISSEILIDKWLKQLFSHIESNFKDI